jgi:hypothetical protein
MKKSGAKGIRTPDLLIANETLYQLSYSPFNGGIGVVVTGVSGIVQPEKRSVPDHAPG